MRVEKAIEKRRSIKLFKNKKVDDKKIEKILYCGTLAPSAKNRQPWKFVVITNKDKIFEIANLMTQKQTVEVENYIKNKLKVRNTIILTAEVMRRAPVLILIFKSNNPNWQTGDTISIGACIENMCLKAVEYGLAAVIIRDVFYSLNDICKSVNWNDEEYELSTALVIGYADEKPPIKPKKHYKDVTTWIK